jgi:hypothetical protein
MTAKEELKKIRKMGYLISQMAETADVLRSQLTGSAKNADVRVQASRRHPDPAADRLAKILDLESLITENTDYLVDLKKAAVQTIARMRDEDRKSVLITVIGR